MNTVALEIPNLEDDISRSDQQKVWRTDRRISTSLTLQSIILASKHPDYSSKTIYNKNLDHNTPVNALPTVWKVEKSRHLIPFDYCYRS